MKRILCLLTMFVASAFAQSETADVLGMVHDPSGAALANAAVSLVNQDTGLILKTQTDDGGNFTFLMSVLAVTM